VIVVVVVVVIIRKGIPSSKGRGWEAAAAKLYELDVVIVVASCSCINSCCSCSSCCCSCSCIV